MKIGYQMQSSSFLSFLSRAKVRENLKKSLVSLKITVDKTPELNKVDASLLAVQSMSRSEIPALNPPIKSQFFF